MTEPKTQLRAKYLISARDFMIETGELTRIMGIINMTPDSFSGDGLINGIKIDPGRASRLAKKFSREGADIIDIGGESSRPGSVRITIKEELRRVVPVIKRIVRDLSIPVSIDTYKPQVAQAALDAGASIINNIQGTTLNKNLLKMVRNYNAAIVLMHMRGTPLTMQNKICYSDPISEIINSLQKSKEKCLETGIKSDRIIIDPGIGFGKTVEHNLNIINQLQQFKFLDSPILIGPSRKSFIGSILKNEISKRLLGTIASVCACIMNGAHIIRVHDVRKIKEATIIIDAILNQKAP